MDLELRPTLPELRRRYEAEGLWTSESLGAYLDTKIDRVADAEFRIWSDTRPYQATIGEVRTLATRIAGGLRDRGIGAADVVAFQLPNCVEAVAAFWAAARLGATVVPIVHFYGPKEVQYILRESQARLLVSADAFGWLDYRSNLDELRPALPDLEDVVFIPMGEPSPNLGEFGDATPFPEIATPDLDLPALVAYTSGTTADPKGVVHTHRSIVAEGEQLGAIQRPRPPRPLLNGAPIGHAIGMLAGLLIPLYLRRAIHLTDGWDPAKVLAAMLEADVYAGSGATFFLQSLLDHPDCTEEHVAKMTQVGLGGSAVPVSFAQRATDLGISIMRSYGSTEHPSTTGARYDEPVDKRIETDGHPLAGVDLRIVDEEGRDVAVGEAGEIWSRGPDLCAGYTDPALTRETFTDDGWYKTGDIGVLDTDGWLAITDRKKDIIIRGGETISPLEVEDALLTLSSVAEVAVVAAPDERLGEVGCAFVRPALEVDAPDLAAIREHLERVGIAKQKWPEKLELVEDFPRTPSGKVKKFELRSALRQPPE